jgi:hypothetical protein
MASSITPTLGTAAAQAISPQPFRADAQVASSPSAAQLAQVSQEASQRTATSVSPDPERTAQVPKKVEANYNPQSVKKKTKEQPKTDDESSSTEEADSQDADHDSSALDLLA